MSRSNLPDYYGALEVPRGADEVIIKKSYRQKVLLWHPDKHPANREEAERRIREINIAYEMLSNHLKREQYDQQLAAMEQRRAGVRINTSNIVPRMSIPKEFLLSPMGHPDKFVRCIGNTLYVHTREDVPNVGFDEFFRDARWSLWWRPQQNNMCHLRSQTSAASGERGGLSVTFKLIDNQPPVQADAQISPLQEPQTYLAVVASTEYTNAFKISFAYYPELQLAFKQPTHFVATQLRDEGLVSDFMLVDYNAMIKYKTLNEALIPAVETLGGHIDYISLGSLVQHPTITQYFRTTLRKGVWSQEDWATYFDGHYELWDYDPQYFRLRLRSKGERFLNALQRAGGRSLETMAVVSSANTELLTGLQPEILVGLFATLGISPPTGSSGVIGHVNFMAAQKNLLSVVPEVVTQAKINMQQVLALARSVLALGDGSAAKELATERAEASKALGEAATTRLSQCTSPLGADDMSALCMLPSVNWQAVGEEELREFAASSLAGLPLSSLVPILRAVTEKAAAKPIVEMAITAIESQYSTAPPATAVEALDAMATAGFGLRTAPTLLHKALLGNGGAVCVPFAIAANAVGTLGEKGLEGEELSQSASSLAELRSELETLPISTQLRLMVATTKSSAVADGLLDPVAAVAAASLHLWSMDDVPKLLLAAAKAKRSNGVKNGSCSAEISALFGRAAEIVAPQLPNLSATQLIKVTLAIGNATTGRPLLEAAARDATRRAAELPGTQLLLLTQGLLPLGGEQKDFLKLLDFWASSLREDPSASKHQLLTADQMAKLAQTLAPAVRFHAVYDVVGRRLKKQISELTPAGIASLEAADFPGKASLLRAVKGEPSPPRDRDRRGSDDRGRGGDDRGRGGDDRGRGGDDRGRGGDDRGRGGDDRGRGGDDRGRGGDDRGRGGDERGKTGEDRSAAGRDNGHHRESAGDRRGDRRRGESQERRRGDGGGGHRESGGERDRRRDGGRSPRPGSPRRSGRSRSRGRRRR